MPLDSVGGRESLDILQLKFFINLLRQCLPVLHRRIEDINHSDVSSHLGNGAVHCISNSPASTCDDEILVLEFEHIANTFETMVANDFVRCWDLRPVVLCARRWDMA